MPGELLKLSQLKMLGGLKLKQPRIPAGKMGPKIQNNRQLPLHLNGMVYLNRHQMPGVLQKSQLKMQGDHPKLASKPRNLLKNGELLPLTHLLMRGQLQAHLTLLQQPGVNKNPFFKRRNQSQRSTS